MKTTNPSCGAFGEASAKVKAKARQKIAQNYKGVAAN
jgi:hypothetical protein